MGGLKQRSLWESCGWVRGESSRGGGDKEALGGKQYHKLEMTAVKLGSQILDFPFPVHFSEDLLLLWASVYKVRKKVLSYVLKSRLWNLVALTSYVIKVQLVNHLVRYVAGIQPVVCKVPVVTRVVAMVEMTHRHLRPLW